MATKPAPNARFMVLGKSKYVHVVRTKAWDVKNSGCQQVRKYQVAGNVPKKGLSPEAASALDPCPQCDAKREINLAMPREVKEQAKKDKRDDVMQRAKDSTKTKGQLRKEGKGKGKPAKDKADKPAKAPKATKSGPRSTGGEGDKAQALAQFAKDHGWSSTTFDGEPGVRVVAKRGDETITCYFVDGKYDTVRFATLTVGSWSGKLRGVHSCRRQIAGEGRDRPYPNPGQGRSGPRASRKSDPASDVPEDESPEDAKRRVPFMLDDDPVAIIDAIKGMTIKWRNGTSGTLEEAWLPAEASGKKTPKIAIEDHPKSGRRFVTFMTVMSITEHGEQYGPTRSVFLDKIVRVQ